MKETLSNKVTVGLPKDAGRPRVDRMLEAVPRFASGKRNEKFLTIMGTLRRLYNDALNSTTGPMRIFKLFQGKSD